MSTTQLDEYLTTQEAAEVLRTSAATLRYWRHVGRGPRFIRSGKKVLYAASDLRDYLDAGRQPA